MNINKSWEKVLEIIKKETTPISYKTWFTPTSVHSIDKDLKVEINTATNKAIVSVTNNSKKAAKYPEYYAFFYKDGKLVYDNWGFVDDADGEIKPGATQREEASCYEEFDDVKVYVHSDADKE